MSGNLVVGAVIVIIVAACLGYLVWQRRKGRCSCGVECGCKDKDDEGSCDCCRKDGGQQD